MNNPYELRSWGKHLREENLGEEENRGGTR
jgi:hypothetical protein